MVLESVYPHKINDLKWVKTRILLIGQKFERRVHRPMIRRSAASLGVGHQINRPVLHGEACARLHEDMIDPSLPRISLDQVGITRRCWRIGERVGVLKGVLAVLGEVQVSWVL